MAVVVVLVVVVAVVVVVVVVVVGTRKWGMGKRVAAVVVVRLS